MKKRFLAVFLALVLSVALFPAPALAADTEPTLTGAEMVALLPSERPEVIPRQPAMERGGRGAHVPGDRRADAEPDSREDNGDGKGPRHL